MNQLKCEMCGSTDLLKQDGMFVCQVCGTKYSVEEAKKMMIEGTVEVTGSVKIDNTDELEKLYTVARNATTDMNWDEAIKYYEKILRKDPSSWEANFYTVYLNSQAKSLVEDNEAIELSLTSVKNCLKPVLTLIKETVHNKKDQITAVKEVANNTTKLSEMYYKASLSVYNQSDKSIYLETLLPTVRHCFSVKDIMYSLGDSIYSQFSDYEELQSVMLDAWREGIQQHGTLLNELLPYFKLAETAEHNLFTHYVTKIQKYEPNYLPQEIKKKPCPYEVAKIVKEHKEFTAIEYCKKILLRDPSS